MYSSKCEREGKEIRGEETCDREIKERKKKRTGGIEENEINVIEKKIKENRKHSSGNKGKK